MKPLSRTLEKYTGSYLARRRRKRIALTLILVTAAAICLYLVLRPPAPLDQATRQLSKRNILADWSAKKWDEVLVATSVSLSAAPLDSFYLTFKGFASFYKAIELPEGEDRMALLEDAVISLRKAMVSGGSFPTAQVEYVLGKSYYLLGRHYYDASAKYIEASIAHGYSASDSREFLALAYAGLGDTEKAVRNFEAALAISRAELLLLAAAKAQVDAGDSAKAESLLSEALASGKDTLVLERCRLLLSEIYRARDEFARSEEQLSLILQKNPDSAEAHYRMGLSLHNRGDPVRARAEWRKAVAIDPMHAAARQKLTEKL